MLHDKPNDEQRDLLHLMSLRPHGIVLRDDDHIRILVSMTLSPWVSDVFDVPGGGVTAKITENGRKAVERI